jgi:type II secretory pathway pseudopilin PulG
MKDRSPRAFTLVEMIVVIAILIVLAGLVAIGAASANRNSARSRALTEMKAITSGLNAYKQDNGAYPQTSATDQLDPRRHFDPASGSDSVLYQKASLDLYKALTGDTALTGQPAQGTTSYSVFPRTQLSIANGSVRYIQDPFGYSYGYSTIAAKAEAAYQVQMHSDPATPRPSQTAGFDPDFDLWSTAGGTNAGHQAKWVKKWGNN